MIDLASLLESYKEWNSGIFWQVYFFIALSLSLVFFVKNKLYSLDMAKKFIVNNILFILLLAVLNLAWPFWLLVSLLMAIVVMLFALFIFILMVVKCWIEEGSDGDRL